MAERSSWTLALTMIFNPVLLLFYQNFSYVPQSQVSLRNPASAIVLPQIAKAESSLDLATPACLEKFGPCPQIF